MYNCFNGLWIRRCDTTTSAYHHSSPWYTTGTTPDIIKICLTNLPNKIGTLEQVSYKNNNSADDSANINSMENEDIRELVKRKADRHHEYYTRFFSESVETQDSGIGTTSEHEVAISECVKCNPMQSTTRQRRTGVYEKDAATKRTIFRSVRDLTKRYQQMVEHTTNKIQHADVNTVKSKSLLSVEQRQCKRRGSTDDTYGYCSSTSDEELKNNSSQSWETQHTTVQRSGSTDSAVGGSDDEVPPIVPISNASNHRDTGCFWSGEDDISRGFSPYSPRGSVDHMNVPSKTLIEAKYVPYPVGMGGECERKLSDEWQSEEGDVLGISDSRRQSVFTDDGDDTTKYKFFRTPSVVVSDYSDDFVGLTLEDIEYFRAQHGLARASAGHNATNPLGCGGGGGCSSSSPDSSLHSSCSNLNYCGSTISALDTEFTRHPYGRKLSSAGSVCSSNLSADDEELDCGVEDAKEEDERDGKREKGGTGLAIDKPSPWRKLRNIVQWTPFFQTYKKQRYPWVQLAGHQGNFKAGPDQGTILKKLCEKEEKCFKVLMKDVLRPYVPEYRGLVTSDDGECSYLQLQDLLGDFVSPCVMDCKIGVRTYLEEELAKAKEKSKLRKDMYDKMCQIDSNAPTDEEHRLKGVTKPRYMVWRETISSTETLGFRIEGIRRGDGTSSKDFKTTKSGDQVMEAFIDFSQGFLHAVPKYIQRLKAIKATLESSNFFKSHEVIGSSLLFVHDRNNANVWLIDFAKTIRLPEDIDIDHSSKWKVGNHEDGYLIGVNNLISIFVSVLEKQPLCITPPPLIIPDSIDNRLTADPNENDVNNPNNNDNLISHADNT